MSGGGCGNVQPCGGDLVGTWAITQICLGPIMGDPSCPGDTVSNASATENGTLAFASGGTYTANVSITLMYTEMTPVACIDPSTCADLPAIYAASGAAASCTGTSTCTCSIAAAAPSSAEAGTYAASGTSVTVTPAGGTARSMGYCVQGNSVHFLHFNSSGQVTTEEIAQRQ